MANSAWFFSTIAQAVAAAIGFVIAFTATVYSVRRTRFQGKLREFQSDVGAIHEDFGPAIDAFADYFREEHDFPTRAEIDDLEAWKSGIDKPILGEFWYNLDRVHAHISSIPSEDKPENLKTNFGCV
ncbi:MAG: hypothetical protein ABEI57_03835 [Halapricum sp.]